MFEELKTAIKHYVSFSEEECNLVLSHFTPLTVPAKTQLVKLDKVATNIYFIVKGAIRSYYLFEVEEEHCGFFFENSFTTSLSSFINNEPSNQVVETLEESELLCLKKSDYDKLNNTMPKMNVLTRKIIEKAFVRLENYKRSLLCEEPQTRLSNLIKSQPEILKRVSERNVASYLDIPLLAFSKMIRNL